MDTIDKIQTPEIREFVAQIPDSRPVGFRALYPQANPLACDLLEDLLVFEPSDRIDVCQALAHPLPGAAPLPRRRAVRALYTC